MLAEQVSQTISTYQQESTALHAKFNTKKHLVATLGATPPLGKILINHSKVVDDCLQKLWRIFALDEEASITLFAVGGYGRHELFPFSDIDLLIIFTTPLNTQQQAKIESFVQSLWEIGTTISQSVRSLDDCLSLAQQDHTILTSLLNHRQLAGTSKAFSSQLRACIETHSACSSELFFQKKNQEYDARHRKHADTEYNLEPNIKNAPGGLRDVQTLLWIAKYTLGMGSLTKLVQRHILNTEEQTLLQNGYDFVASVRYCLHLVAGRDDNRLLFDYQKRVAQELGFIGDKKNQAVEHFMKTYYRHASAIASTVDLLLENLQEEILGASEQTDQPINSRFTLKGSKIAIRHDQVFADNPSAILELFYLLGRSSDEPGIRANTIRKLKEARHKIDHQFCNQPENTALFLLILQSPYRLTTQLKRMKRYDILGRYLPEFGQVIGQMQFDLFHVYTVDAHALLVVENMRLLRHPQAKDTFPLATKIIHTLPNRTLLYIAGLFHDIAKGRGGDHSMLGAADAEHFCQRHQLPEADTALVTWLVLEHLVMSTTAQKMDISDHQVIEEFANKVSDQERLDYLYLLTICDIAGTNPKLLNPWRLSLINQLYLETSQLFKRGLEISEHWAGRAARKRAQATDLLCAKGLQEHHFNKLWHNFGDRYFSKYSVEDICWHTQAILQQNDPTQPLVIAGLTQESSTQVYTQIFIYMQDCQHLFIKSVTALSRLGLNILDAQVLTSKGGHTLNTFIVDDNDSGIISNTPQIYQKMCGAIKNALISQDTIPAVTNHHLPRTYKYFHTASHVNIYNVLQTQFTIIWIETLDRAGLLALIGHVFAQHELVIHCAKILTFGERAEDFFYVSYKQQQLHCPDLTAQLFQALHAALAV